MSTRDFLKICILVCCLLFVPGKQLVAQSKAGIFNVDFTVNRDSLIVTYDILKSKFSERFNITFTVKAITGKTYSPKTVYGDIGNNVFGGKGKRIIWEIAKDNVLIDEEIFVEVHGQPVFETEQVVQKEEPAPVTNNWDDGSRTFSKGGALALSAILPGLGITKQKEGGAYWLLSIATYGLAAGGIILNASSSSTYDKYTAATTAEERNSLYDKALSQNKTGNILIYSAIGVWVGNMVWTLLTPNKIKTTGFSYGGTVDPVGHKPLLCLRYKF